MATGDEPTKKKHKKLPPFWQVCAVAFGVWFILAWMPFLFRWSGIGGKPHETGDAAGFAASLFSGLAFAGVIYAIFLQREELRLQRRELKLTRAELKMTREEMKRSADAQTKSEEALKNQAISLFNAAYLNALDSLHRMCKTNDLALPITQLRKSSLLQANLEAVVETLGRQTYTDQVQILSRAHDIDLTAMLTQFLNDEPPPNCDPDDRTEFNVTVQQHHFGPGEAGTAGGLSVGSAAI